MNDEFQEVLQISAKLYALLGEKPSSDGRDTFIEEIDSLLDKRSEKITALKNVGFEFNKIEKSHNLLYDLDKGIIERLQLVMQSVKGDLKAVQSSKKNEQQYSNPYGHVQVMDGMYYDKKK